MKAELCNYACIPGWGDRPAEHHWSPYSAVEVPQETAVIQIAMCDGYDGLLPVFRFLDVNGDQIGSYGH